MDTLIAISELPTDAAWWQNDGHGRELVCRHDSATVFLRVTQGFCSHCRQLMHVNAN